MPSVRDIESARATAGGRFNGDVGLMLTRVRGVPLTVYGSSRCRLLELLAVLEGPTDIDEPKHRDGWAIEHPCRPTADANAEVPF